MNAEVELISTMGEKKAVTRPPIQMEFQVSNQYSICIIYPTLYSFYNGVTISSSCCSCYFLGTCLGMPAGWVWLG